MKTETILPTMTALGIPTDLTDLTNWSKTARSSCHVCRARDVAGIMRALEVARTHGLSVIPHGAGHSYTDAALNTSGIVLDVTPMRRILSWDPARGVMRVEPGVTMGDMVRLAWKDGWWPNVTPSTLDATIGGCAAMNVTGKNAWNCGSFGEHLLAIDVLLATGETRTLMPEQDVQLFSAFVGSLGLLGIITSVTVQLRRITSERVSIHVRSAASLADIFTIFAEEAQTSDFLEAWVDGFAGGRQLGRGRVSCAAFSDATDSALVQSMDSGIIDRLATPLVRSAATLSRPGIISGVRMANSARYWWNRLYGDRAAQQRALIPYTFYPSAAFAGYHALLPEGIESFQAFVPGQQAREIFADVLRYSQQHACMPVWCIIKQHRPDPFLLSYQLDGFSLELNFRRTRQNTQTLERVLRQMIELVVGAGGRFYLAKDHFLTHAQYRRSLGDTSVNTFLDLKRRYDPEGLLQSDLFQRVFCETCGRE